MKTGDSEVTAIGLTRGLSSVTIGRVSKASVRAAYAPEDAVAPTLLLLNQKV